MMISALATIWVASKLGSYIYKIIGKAKRYNICAKTGRKKIPFGHQLIKPLIYKNNLIANSIFERFHVSHILAYDARSDCPYVSIES